MSNLTQQQQEFERNHLVLKKWNEQRAINEQKWLEKF